MFMTSCARNRKSTGKSCVFLDTPSPEDEAWSRTIIANTFDNGGYQGALRHMSKMNYPKYITEDYHFMDILANRLPIRLLLVVFVFAVLLLCTISVSAKEVKTSDSSCQLSETSSEIESSDDSDISQKHGRLRILFASAGIIVVTGALIGEGIYIKKRRKSNR